jgi:hypothetical protein
MRTYIGTKIIKAKPMTRAEYNTYRGWDLPENENGDDGGYLVEYEAAPNVETNHVDHAGYISWSPDSVFEESYRGPGTMNFGHALEILKSGGRVSRQGWNGKNMFIFLVNGSTFTVNREPLLSILGEGTEVNYHGHVDMKTADGMIVPWLCSQTDMLAEDWGIA